jgi:hypothetical protein
VIAQECVDDTGLDGAADDEGLEGVGNRLGSDGTEVDERA